MRRRHWEHKAKGHLNAIIAGIERGKRETLPVRRKGKYEPTGRSG